jgi:hypothetical protein
MLTMTGHQADIPSFGVVTLWGGLRPAAGQRRIPPVQTTVDSESGGMSGRTQRAGSPAPGATPGAKEGAAGAKERAHG